MATPRPGCPEVALKEGKPAEAQTLAARAVAAAREKNMRPELARGLAHLAQALLAQGKSAEALAAAQEGSALADRLGIPDARIVNMNVEGRARLALGQKAEARRAWETAIGVVEGYRQRVAGGAQERQRFFEAWLGPFHALVDLLVEDGALEDALAYAERARARGLVEVLQHGQVDLTANLTSEERAEERRLESRLAFLQSRAREAAGSGALGSGDAPGDQVREARQALDHLRARLYARHPELRLARGEVEVVSAREAEEPVADGRTAVLLYTVAPQQTHLFVLASTGGRAELTAYRIAIEADDLRRQVEAFRKAVAARDLELRAGRDLFRLLLAPAWARLAGRTRLVLVPDGPLWELPFQALQPTQRRFLIEDTAVMYAPSLTTLQALRARREPLPGASQRGLLAVGNPSASHGLSPLPEVEREVRALARLYGKEAVLYLADEAREGRVRAEAGRHRSLHFAAHGLLDSASPMYSALLLAAEPAGSDDDGRLEARELINLRLIADLAVLSACETGRGRIGSGEGMIGLSWALLMAGSANVVVSQWRVDAASTEALMVEMHRRLRQESKTAGAVDVAAALRQAALTVKAGARYRHPFYWAGFTLIGSGRVRTP